MKTMSTYLRPIRAWRFRHTLAALLLLFSAGISTAQPYYNVRSATAYYNYYSQTSTAPPSPLGWYYTASHMQYLYTAAELTASGLTAGYIDRIAFRVIAVQSSNTQPTNNYSVGIASAGTTSSLSVSAGWLSVPTIYSGSYTPLPFPGWNYISVNSGSMPGGGFYWNGTDNVVVDVCKYGPPNSSSSTSTGPGEAGVAYDTAANKVLYRCQNIGLSMCGNPAFIPTGVSNQRPVIRFVRLTPCPGFATKAGAIYPAGTTSGICPGSQYSLVDTGATPAFAMAHQWQISTNGGTTWTDVPGATTSRLTTPPILTNTRYRYRAICTNGPDTAYSTPALLNVSSTSFPAYASLPFTEGFENWTNGCSSLDLPSYNWTTSPSTGYLSWRREDQGVSNGGWGYSLISSYAMPTPPEGSHAAGVGTYYIASSTVKEGSMSLYVNCSATTGAKELRFWYDFNYPYSSSGSPGYVLNVDTSTDGGTTFGLLYTAPYMPQGWNQVVIPFNSNSANTVIRFRGTITSTYNDGLYIDKVQVLPACSGKPTAGVIDTILPCAGQAFKLNATGTSQVAGLTYQWQYLPSGATAWAALPGGTAISPTATITTNTQFRVIVTCTNSSLSDTSAVVTGVIQPFYYCYCSFLPQYLYQYTNIGNVLLTRYSNGAALINNGSATPQLSNPTANKIYSDFRRTLTAPTLIRDSVYRLQVTEFTLSTFLYTGYPANAWLDSNRDGIFQSNERILNKNTTPLGIARDTFRIRQDAQVGLTGLRISYFGPYSNTAPTNPCGTYGYQGEVEDYLVNIDYQPCNGPLSPGTAFISDTSICPGYGVDMWDTGYQINRTGGIRGWQTSTNNGASWSNIPGSAGKDTLLNVIIPRFNPTQYRFYVVCSNTNDTSKSNVLSVTTPDPVRCYPVAQAIGGPAADSSDIGAFRLGSFVNPATTASAGPHLMNPFAHRRRTDYTLLGPIYLEADSSYRLSVFQTMPGGNHADALVSVWIDFNRDLMYESTSSSIYPSELVFQGRTTPPDFYLDTIVTMPHNLIPNVRTGVRVMLSNDLSMANTNPVFVGAGAFTSGEVEDYIAYFGRPGLSVNNSTALLQDLSLFPNPTNGKVTLMSDAIRSVSHMDVFVTTITGQQIMSRSFSNVGTHFSTELDLSGAAKGIYFVELRADGEKITRKLIVR